MTRETTLPEIEAEAELLRVCSGFKLSIEQARDRVAGACGWVSYAHCLTCKSFRGAQ